MIVIPSDDVTPQLWRSVVKNIMLNEVMRWKNAMRTKRTRGEYCFLMEVKYYMDFMPRYLLKTAFYGGRNANARDRF